jgi:hypothetical protein
MPAAKAEPERRAKPNPSKTNLAKPTRTDLNLTLWILPLLAPLTLAVALAGGRQG